MKYFKLNFSLVAPVAILLSVSVSAQTSLADATERLKLSGYPVLTMQSFSDTKLEYALTGVYKAGSDKNGIYFLAMLAPDTNGASFAFKTFKACTPTDEANPTDHRFIWIGGQKIKALYVCRQNPGEEGTAELFILTSPASLVFAKNAFARNEYVIVQLDDLAIPFKTNGFARDLARVGGKAL